MASIWEASAVLSKEQIYNQPNSIATRPAVKVPSVAGARPDAGLQPNAAKVPMPARAVGVMDLGFEG